ncbi:three component ABC system middle component [Adonisia turfae]|uniref:Uncharacterized protein n=1 Tax=Adonisia turfae CCMR0081 TaxID=2292702 RepID=A0A6M0RYV3_9CYAN|nr:three component ABC system middle component [Adonisia turfae]NEZ61063.1 hypothetical protein [Adonisia turfae CCMR0081]
MSISTSSWSERPIEQARLLNPAFLATLLWSCASGYSSVDDQGIPYALSFVALPVILHKPTRESLPNTSRTSLAAWLTQNPQVQIRFAERAASLVPLVKQSILFGADGRLLEVTPLRILNAAKPSAMNRFLRESSEEVKVCMKKAKFVGKWFASSGNYTTVMALWGVEP